MRFDLVDLRLFDAVARTGSISRGAEQTNLALASASARIGGMEAMLGVRLLERGRRGVTPTAAGRALLGHARLITDSVERMRGDLRLFSSGLKGEIRILSNTAALVDIVPRALKVFLAAHPGVDVAIEERTSAEIASAVADGQVEFGIVADNPNMGSLETRPLAVDRLTGVAARSHPLGDRPQIAFNDLLDHPFVGLAGGALHDHLAQQAARLGRHVAYRVRLRSFDAVARLVEAGIGVGVLPLAAIARYGSSDLTSIRLTDAWAHRRLLVCARRFAAMSAHARACAASRRRDRAAVAWGRMRRPRPCETTVVDVIDPARPRGSDPWRGSGVSVSMGVSSQTRSGAMSRMRVEAIALILAAMLPCSTGRASVPEHVEEIALPGGARQRVLITAPASPRGAVVMLPGGAGDLGIKADGDLLHGRNFVVRTRQLWAALGYAVLIPDTIAGNTLRGLRSSPAYASIVEDLVALAHRQTGGSVFLLGTSQGAIAAMNGAAHLASGQIAGVVLTESVSRLGGSGETVFDAEPERVAVPALVVANDRDACRVSPPADADRIAAAMTGSPSVQVLRVAGGERRSGDCGSLSPHGYDGIEADVVGKIAAWMAKVALP